MTSDSDLPSDVSVDTASHPGCWLIPITVEGVQTLALLDTGASVSMMGRPLYQKVQQVSRLRLQTQDTPQLEGVGGLKYRIRPDATQTASPFRKFTDIANMLRDGRDAPPPPPVARRNETMLFREPAEY